MPSHKWERKAALLSKLHAYAPSVQARIRPAMASGADRIVAMQKALAPTLAKPDRERIPGALKASIHWEWGRVARSVLGGVARVGADARDFVISFVAGDATAFYARFVEFGTKGYAAGDIRVSYRKSRGKTYRGTVKRAHAATRAQPFFYPAARALLPAVRREIQAAVRAATRAVIAK